MNATIRRLGIVALLTAATAITATPAAGATGPYLVKDIDTNESSNPRDLTALGNTLFFTATGGGKGRELYKSDGTTMGTVRVKDIRPGSAGSHPRQLTVAGSRLFFTANDGSTGLELYVSDGTSAGTKRLTDINSASSGSDIEALRNVKGTLLFLASGGVWRSDGTVTGTKFVKSYLAGAILREPPIVFRGAIYFGLDKCYGGPGHPGICEGKGLWKSDGTAAGTGQFWKSSDDASYPENLVRTATRLYWTASDESDQTLVTDGTKAGTKVFQPFKARDLTPVGSRLFYWTYDYTNENPSLWVVAGKTAPEVLAEFEPGALSGLTNVGGKLFFSAGNYLAASQLQTSDGTPEGTGPVQGCCPDQAYPGNITPIGTVAYFTALSLVTCEEACDREIWRSTGTDAGTFRLGDIRPGEQSSVPASLTNVGGTLYFTANDGTHGRELWRYVP